MLAWATWFENWGKDVIFLAGFVGAVGLLSKTKGAKWLWAHLVSGPLSDWQTRVVGRVVDEKVALPNGGSSLRDAVDELVAAQTNLTETQATLAGQQSVLLEWTAEQAERQSEWAEYVGSEFAQVHERIDRLCDEVGRLKQRKGVA